MSVRKIAKAAALPPSKIGQFSVPHLLKRAEDVATEKGKHATHFDPEAEDRIPRFDRTELELGKVLGRGGFCAVSEIINISLREDGEAAKQTLQRSQSGNGGDVEEDHFMFANVVQDRQFMTKNCVRNKKDCRYAIKILHNEVYKDPQTFIHGVIDLAIEAKFLAVIRHPNIIKMRAVSVASPFSLNYFVVLDRLYEILSRRLPYWRKRKPTGMKKLMDRKGKKEIAFWLERITVAHDLACALQYLHSLNIVYRDLKPDNIGFDVRGDVKIFDFGLAKEFNPSQRMQNGLYKLTGDTGSPRYMAPEVAKEQPYNETVDVYSFSILLWELCALDTPFEGFQSIATFRKRVVDGGVRPKPDPKWPKDLQNLMQKGWSTQITTRPSMADVAKTLRDEIESKSDAEVNDILDVSRKSELSLRGSMGSQTK